MWGVPRGGIRGPPGRVKTSGSGKPFLEQVSRHMLLVGEAPWGGSGDSQEGQGGEGKQSLGREYNNFRNLGGVALPGKGLQHPCLEDS